MLGFAETDAPITVWLRQLESGDAQAAEPLYQHFCQRLQELARQKIPSKVQAAYDQDDVTLSAFYSVFLGMQEQRFQLRDRDDFWRLLLTIAERKIAKRVRYETRDRRDVRRVIQDCVFQQPRPGDTDRVPAGVESLAGREPTPQLAAEISETCEALLASLPDENARAIALLKLQNYSADEIAARLDCTRRTVQRRLLVIRRTWQNEGGLEENGELDVPV